MTFKSKSLLTALAMSIGMASISAHAETGERQAAIPKIMAGVNSYHETLTFGDEESIGNPVLENYAVGFEYEFVPAVGIELRHYFGGDDARITHTDEDATKRYVQLESATALLLNFQTPELWRLSAYVQGGPAFVKNSFNDENYTRQTLAYGAGIELKVNEDMFIFADVLHFHQYDLRDSNIGSVKNRMAMIGFAMKF